MEFWTPFKNSRSILKSKRNIRGAVGDWKMAGQEEIRGAEEEGGEQEALRGGQRTACTLYVVKGSQQWESRGARNVSICPNLARTAAIEVHFSINFAVVLDFIYFRFRPSKAKSIGNVLPNRRNAAYYLQRFFFKLILLINFLALLPMHPKYVYIQY